VLEYLKKGKGGHLMPPFENRAFRAAEAEIDFAGEKT